LYFIRIIISDKTTDIELPTFRGYLSHKISPGLHRTCHFHGIRRSIDYNLINVYYSE